MTKKEVATKQSFDLTEFGDFGDDGIDVKDIIIPKVMLMQALSELVSDDKAQVGEYRDSLEGALLGDSKNQLELIFFGHFKTWRIFERNGSELTFKRTEPVTPINATLPYEDGSTVNQMCFNFYCLPVAKIGECLPHVFTFTKTSSQVGRKLLTIMTQMKKQGLPMPAKVFSFSSKKEKNDKGTWVVPTFSIARDSTREELITAKTWKETLDKSSVSIHEETKKEEGVTF